MQYEESDDLYIREDSIPNQRERENYYSPSKSISFYQAITFVTSVAHSIIQDAPRALISALTVLTIPAGRYLIKKTKQEFSKRSTNSKISKSLDEHLK